MKLIEQICKLWWVEAGRGLTDPYSSESLQALELVLREDFDYDDNVVEYVMESIMRTPTHFKIGGDTDSGIDVDDDETAVSAVLSRDRLIALAQKSEFLDEEEEEDDKQDAEDDIKKNSLTQYEKDRLEEVDASKMVSNPNPKGRKKMVTYGYAQQWMDDNPDAEPSDEFKKDTGQGEYDKSEPTSKSDLDRGKFDKKEKKHKDNPDGPTRKEILDDLNNGNLEVLSEYQNGVSDNREKGIAGAGGAVASEGESKYCSAVDTDFEKWDTDNKDSIEKKQSEVKDRKRTSEEIRIAKQMGLNPSAEEFNTHLAKREVWANQQLEKVKSDTDSVFYKKFGGKNAKTPEDMKKAENKYKDWMNVAYDGGKTTQGVIEDSPIDTSKPHKTIQSTSEVDQAVQAHFEDSVKNAKTPEDKKHAETQLKNFNKFKGYHDTYVIGKDENGRNTYMGISNKKDDQIRDPQNNTTPRQRFEQLESRYGKDVAEGVTKSLEKNIQRVSEVQETTVKTASEMEVTDDFVAVCETKKMQPYVDGLKESPTFVKHLESKGLDVNKLNTKQLLTEMNDAAKEMISQGKKPPYNPYGKIAIKVGEESQKSKFQKKYPDINYDDNSVKGAIDIKQTEKAVVKEAHKAVVTDLVEADKPDGYSEDNPDADNGKHQQGYIGSVLDACHIDTYIDMDSDDGMLLQMGINGVKPSMIRDCVAENSGFKGDSSTPEGKTALKDHLRKRCRVTPGGDRITITDNDKEVELFEDDWRTAGTSQKVATHFGKGMRTCLQQKAAK